MQHKFIQSQAEERFGGPTAAASPPASRSQAFCLLHAGSASLAAGVCGSGGGCFSAAGAHHRRLGSLSLLTFKAATYLGWIAVSNAAIHACWRRARAGPAH